MSKIKTVFACMACGAHAAKWVGRCPSCGDWNSMVEEVDAPSPIPHRPFVTAEQAVPIAQVPVDRFEPVSTGSRECDRVLGGGVVPGSVTLLGGVPGVGKSTLLLQLSAARAGSGRCLYVSAEESAQQVRSRAERLEGLHPDLWLVATTSLPEILAHVQAVEPEFLVIDSIQTIADPELSSAPGSVGQVRHCAHRLVVEAKARDLATVLVGHVTKDGTLAGPRVLEHVVDTVLEFAGDRDLGLRQLRAVKHRFGSTSELGLFEMSDRGLRGVRDPSALFLADRLAGVPGSVVVATSSGHRPLLVEVQALTDETALPSPRRSAQGLDQGRLAVLLAVLERRVGLSVAKLDVYALAVGGVKVVEPGADLGLALAVASSVVGHPLGERVVACGEVGLGGEVRRVAQIDRRLREASRHGFTTAVVPPGTDTAEVDGLKVVPVRSLAEALEAVGVI